MHVKFSLQNKDLVGTKVSKTRRGKFVFVQSISNFCAMLYTDMGIIISFYENRY